MKKYLFSFISLILILMCIFALSGCNAKKKVNDIKTETKASKPTAIDSVIPTDSDSLSTSASVYENPTAPDESYVKETNELEIMTIPNDTQQDLSEDVSPTKVPDTKYPFTYIPTEPEPTLIPEGEEIELPFVPAP